MSVLITVKVRADVDTFRRALVERKEELVSAGERGRANGCLHHRFGVGEGYVLVVDEWESHDQFERFFTAPELQSLIDALGADRSTPPEITVAETIDSADEF